MHGIIDELPEPVLRARWLLSTAPRGLQTTHNILTIYTLGYLSYLRLNNVHKISETISNSCSFLQSRVVQERRRDSRGSLGSPLTNGALVDDEDELAEAGSYIRSH